jgi:hypothetical protein
MYFVVKLFDRISKLINFFTEYTLFLLLLVTICNITNANCVMSSVIFCC